MIIFLCVEIVQKCHFLRNGCTEFGAFVLQQVLCEPQTLYCRYLDSLLPLFTACSNGKNQESPNFSVFHTLGSLSNDPVFDPGRFGKRSDGTKLYAKPDVERVKKTRFMEDARKIK